MENSKAESFFDKLISSLTKAHRPLYLILVVQILLHISVLPLGPLGQHSWRQVVGHSMAYNYATEDKSFLNQLLI